MPFLCLSQWIIKPIEVVVERKCIFGRSLLSRVLIFRHWELSTVESTNDRALWGNCEPEARPDVAGSRANALVVSCPDESFRKRDPMSPVS